MYTMHTGQKFTSLFQRTHYDGFPISDETPLYAAPQLPEQCANIAQKSEKGDVVRVEHGAANSHFFDDQVLVGDECIAFANEPWSSRLAAALRPTRGEG